MPIKLMCAGDLMAGENVHHYHRGILTRFRGRYNELISKKVRGIILTSDILLLNFEASLAPDNEIDKLTIDRGVYVAPIETIDLLKGLNTRVVVSIANNHFGQHGIDAANYTIVKLEENGIGVSGKDHQPLIIEQDSYRMMFYAVSLVSDKHYEGAYFKSDYASLINDLNLTEKQADEIRILSIHWGEEYYTLENEAQKKLAFQLSEAGFDYIIGHHPHVVQPVSKIGKTNVFYSHGNFIFDQNFSGLTQKGLVSLFSIPEGETKLYLSQQKDFRLVQLSQISEKELQEFCQSNFSSKKPLIMRIKMKLELIYRFYELNGAIIKKFSSKLFKA